MALTRVMQPAGHMSVVVVASVVTTRTVAQHRSAVVVADSGILQGTAARLAATVVVLTTGVGQVTPCASITSAGSVGCMVMYMQNAPTFAATCVVRLGTRRWSVQLSYATSVGARGTRPEIVQLVAGKHVHNPHGRLPQLSAHWLLCSDVGGSARAVGCAAKLATGTSWRAHAHTVLSYLS